MMRITHIIWLPEIEDKLARKHHLSVLEVEEALYSDPQIRFVEKGHREDEDLYAAYGRTEEGRYILVYFILKQTNEALIISARDMDRKEQRLYERRRN
jgi:uncharacterized protein